MRKDIAERSEANIIRHFFDADLYDGRRQGKTRTVYPLNQFARWTLFERQFQIVG